MFAQFITTIYQFSRKQFNAHLLPECTVNDRYWSQVSGALVPGVVPVLEFRFHEMIWLNAVIRLQSDITKYTQ